MAIPEACGLWIEQRVQEELEAKEETGVSLREIGRRVAAEVEKYFETRVNPQTIFSRVQRANADSNESTKSKPAENINNSTPEIIKDRKPQGGGKRDGAGRPKKKEGKDNMAKKQYGAHDVDLSRVNGALSFSIIAINTLERILPDDPYRNQAFEEVEAWIQNQRRKDENSKN